MKNISVSSAAFNMANHISYFRAIISFIKQTCLFSLCLRWGSLWGLQKGHESPGGVVFLSSRNTAHRWAHFLQPGTAHHWHAFLHPWTAPPLLSVALLGWEASRRSAPAEAAPISALQEKRQLHHGVPHRPLRCQSGPHVSQSERLNARRHGDRHAKRPIGERKLGGRRRRPVGDVRNRVSGQRAAAETQHRSACVRPLRAGPLAGLGQRDPGSTQTLEEAHRQGQRAFHQNEAVPVGWAEHPGITHHSGSPARWVDPTNPLFINIYLYRQTKNYSDTFNISHIITVYFL